jgi:hypothetical protein
MAAVEAVGDAVAADEVDGETGEGEEPPQAAATSARINAGTSGFMKQESSNAYARSAVGTKS